MVWLQIDPSGNYHISFRYGGKKFKRSLKTKLQRIAEQRMLRLEETLALVESGRIDVPATVDIPAFLLSDGKISNKSIVQELRLDKLCQEFFEQIPPGSLEPRTVKMMEYHRNHLLRILGANLNIQSLSFSVLQNYVSKRSTEPGIRERSLSPITIKKELVTFRAMWNWAIRMGLITNREFPSKGLRFPRSQELPPFQTFELVRKLTANLDPSSSRALDLWASVYLNRDEIEELLDHVQKNAQFPFIYPMFAMAAHTGARRSELLRSKVSDIGEGVLTIHEKKRKKGRNSTRQVPLSSRLRSCLEEWVKTKPNSTWTFPNALDCRWTGNQDSPMTASQCQHHFHHSLIGSDFEHLRGWHTLRHSFCSNCAAQGIDPRIIDSWVGHTTEEMRRRYQHLFPNTQMVALQSVFG
jgi:integrase